MSRLIKHRKLIIILILVIAIVGGFIAIFLGLGNAAKNESDRVLSNFEKATNAKLYCQNGYGVGIDNDIPWYESIYLSDKSNDLISNDIYEYIKFFEYKQKREYVENNKGAYDKGKSFWDMSAWNADFTINTKVSNEMTLNNCNIEENKNSNLNPNDWQSIIVIKFAKDR